jgi:glycosyltransferase involved in cell wall biosynthesis
MSTELTRNSHTGETNLAEPVARSRVGETADRRELCSVVIPVYNERDSLHAVHDALCVATLTEPMLDWEFVFVDDGSTDDTFSLLTELNRADQRVKVVRLSRNYGFHVAVAAGLRFVSGAAAVILPADLQDHPREIPRFIEKWRAGFHVVWGVRATRQDSRMDRLLSALFAAVIRRIALPNFPKKGTGTFCLLDRKVIDSVNAYPERHRMTPGLILSAGFRQTQIEYDRLQRHTGVSKWSFARKIGHAIDTIVSFSSVPIRLTSMLGIVIAALSFIYAAYLTLGTLLYGRAVEGWTSIIVIMLGLGGLQLFVIGVLGEYLWRMGDEVRRRPLFLVQETAGKFPCVEQEQRSIKQLTPLDGLLKIDDEKRFTSSGG